jgi:hypothetical protein
MTLDQLMALVRAAMPFNAENYPRRAGLEGDAAVAFDLGHALVHEQKADGLIAGHIERFDHGDCRPFDTRELSQLQLAAVKKVWNAVAICNVLGMTEADLAKQARLIAERG